jgi:PAS domain S-box-containing protein
MLFELQAYQMKLQLQNEELERVHKELSASRERFAKLYNLSLVGYIRLNTAGAIQEINPAGAQLLACSQGELIQKMLEDYIHPCDLDDYRSFIQHLVCVPNDAILDIRLKNHKTGCIYVECRGKASLSGQNEIEICLSVNNITDRKQAEQAIAELNEKLEEKVRQQTRDLSESNRHLQKKIAELNDSKHQLMEREAKLNSIFNASIEGIITINMSGLIVSVNTAVETIFGYSEDELIGHSISKLIPLSQKKRHTQLLKKYFPTHLSELTGKVREVEWQRKDQSLVPLDISIAEFSIDGISYFTGIVRDVTQRKRQEQQDKEHLEGLAHVTRLGLMGEMASGIAHEVNQPLTSIAGYTDACLHFIKAENPDLEKLAQVLQKTNEQALKAGQIINRMRDFLRTKKFYRTAADINALVHEAASLCADHFKQNNIILKFELEDRLPSVYVDYVQIEQVILNLLRNSIDALKDLPENTRRLLIIRTYLNDTNIITTQIKDNGPGIDQSEREKILTPFYTTKTSGMGMGLSISRSLVEAHEGILYFNSKPGKGSTFYFTLPARSKSNDL